MPRLKPGFKSRLSHFLELVIFMAYDLLASQSSVLVVTIITFLLTLFLAFVLTKKYVSKKQTQYLYWSLGLWFFALGVLLEIAFAVGIYSQFLIDSYLLVVVLIVELLALGSTELVKTKAIRQGYLAFALLATLFTAYTLAASQIGNVIVSYVVQGNLPLLVIISSSIATFAAAIMLAIIAIKSYIATRNRKMLYIIAGVIIVSVAGTLYIIQFPAFLYIAEFVGILLLWMGFV